MQPKLKLYNTASRKLETFAPFNEEEVKIYTCGPTVYSTPHIGNFAAYIYWDLLVRVLKWDGYGVKRVLNYTDVGHLVSDADDGEDKLEKGARLSQKSVWEVAEYYIKAFETDFQKLNLTNPDIAARATDYIKQDIELVDILRAKGYTYETKDGIYFDTSKFPKYAEFARLNLNGLQAGKRVEFSDEKRNISDFAVWKFIQPDEQHAMRWSYLDRPGYPGWHLECSSIIHSELGETIDVHTGGIDHIPVHHTNEIAQSEAAFDKRLAKYWLHCHHLTIEGQKISKSLGNTYSLADLEERGYSPADFKMWVLMGHYQSERDFSFIGLTEAQTRRLNWRNRIAQTRQNVASKSGADNAEVLDRVEVAINDNLNSPQAFAEIDAAASKDLDQAFWQEIDQIFGLNLLADAPEPSAEQQALLDARVAARTEKDFAKSDRLRNQLLELGIAVLDTKDGQIWQYAK